MYVPDHLIPQETNEVIIPPEENEFPMLDLSAVPWSDVPYFGEDYGKQLGRLAANILSYHAPRASLVEQQAVYCAGHFLGCGRSAPWRAEDPGFERVSALLADRALGNDPRFWSYSHLREEVTRVLAQHDTRRTAREVACYGPVAECLHDADLLEHARFAPKTNLGMQAFLDATRDGRKICTLMCRQPHIQKIWLRYRWETALRREQSTSSTASR